MNTNIKIVDLFAGIGGIRLGFENISNNIECVFTCEWNKFSQQTYLANFEEISIHGDITKLNENHIPDHDILLAGFPCQPFSQAGLKKGFADTRGTLFFDIERILKAKKPQMFLLENVKQLKGHDNGKTLKTILTHLKKIGYENVHKEILKARDFGLPQNRERLYIVGFLDNSIKFKFPKPTLEPTTVGKILDSQVEDKYTISDKLWEGHKRRKKENKLKGNGFGYSIVNNNSEYTNTLSARYYKDGSEILIEQVGKNPRKLTPREAARLQGFPESFQIPVSDTQAYRQFGNSVPVKVVEKIAEQMLNKFQYKIRTTQHDTATITYNFVNELDQPQLIQKSNYSPSK